MQPSSVSLHQQKDTVKTGVDDVTYSQLRCLNPPRKNQSRSALSVCRLFFSNLV